MVLELLKSHNEGTSGSWQSGDNSGLGATGAGEMWAGDSGVSGGSGGLRDDQLFC